MEREFREIVSVLKEAKRRKYIHDFALTGALAVSALSEPRATRDIDILVSLEKVKLPFFVDWIKSAKEYRFTKHHAGRRKDYIKDLVEVPLGSTRADLIIAFHQIEKEAVEKGLPVSVFGKVRLKVVRPEYLIIMKLIAGSDQDYIDSANLWNGTVDRALVRKMAKELFMDGTLKRLVATAKRLTKV